MGNRVATRQDHVRYKIAKLHVQIAAHNLSPLCARKLMVKLHRKQAKPRWVVHPIGAFPNATSGFIHGKRWTAINVGARTEEEALAKGGPHVYDFSGVLR